MMENKLNMTFGRAYDAPDVQVTEVLVEKGFEASTSLKPENTISDLSWGDDYNDFQ